MSIRSIVRLFPAMTKVDFNPKRVLIVKKTTRYDMEKRLSGMSDSEQRNLLKRRGTNADRLLHKHNEHIQFVKHIKEELTERGIDIRVVERDAYDDEQVAWADAIFAAGGDGTFLLAASRVRTSDKPVIGINTDPSGSEGHMCLQRKEKKDKFAPALKRLFDGDFQWLFRQRIRIETIVEGGVGESTQLHDPALNRTPSTTRWEGTVAAKSPRNRNESKRLTEILPVLALNEVFIGESLSSRVSYYELKVDDGPLMKQKSSGLTVCTGTGSTSWFFNINKMSAQSVHEILSLEARENSLSPPPPDSALVQRICDKFNEQLTFSPDLPRLAFAVRDPIFNSTFLPTRPRGFADVVYVKSKGYDTHLVIDGGLSYAFNDGAETRLSVNADDALRTVVFR